MKQLVLFVFLVASCFSVYSKDSLKDHSHTTAKPPTSPSKIRLVTTIDPRKGAGSAKKITSSIEPIKSLRIFSTQPQSGSSIGPLPTLKRMTIRKPLGPDPIRFTMRSSKNSVNAGEEFEITLTAELLPILPSQLFFFDQQKTFRLKLLLPKGAQQTGGNYYDLIGETLKPEGLNQITYTWRGTITSGDSTGCFRLLREVSSASDQALFIEKSQLCVQVGNLPPKDSIAIQPKVDVSASKARTSACSAPSVSWAGNSTSISLSWVAEDNPNFTSSDAPATLQAQTCSGTTKWYQRQADNTGLLVASGSSNTYITHNYIANQSVTYRYYATCVCADGESAPSADFPITITRKAIALTPSSTTACGSKHIYTPLNVQGCPAGSIIKFYTSTIFSWTMASTGSPSIYNDYGGVQEDTYQASCIFKGVEGPRSNSAIITANCIIDDPCAGVSTPSTPTIHQSGNALTSLNVCYDGGLNLIADEGCTGTIKWYRQSDNAEMATGTTYNPNHIQQSVNYYATCSNNCHTSSTSNLIIITVLTQANAPVIHQIDNNTITSISICPNNNVSLTADGCEGTVVWYNQSGVEVGQGSSIGLNVASSNSYYAKCVNSCTTSGLSNSVNITVINTVPPTIHQNGSNLTSLTICPTQLVGLLADPGCQGTVVWYNQNDTYVAEGATFNPSPTASVSYHTRCVNSCTTSGPSNSVNITVLITPASTPPTASGVSVCSGGVASLTASGCANYYWYNGSGQLVATSGSSFTTPALSAATNYFVRCQNACGASDERAIPITITAAPASTPPTASGVSVCSGGVASLTASGCSTTYYWYNGSGQLISTGGGSFTTPALSANTNYFVRCQNPCGASDERAIPITITAAPASTPPTASGVSVCSGGVASLTASGCANYYWYNGSGQLVATSGSSFTTPALSAATNYFVRCQNACGASDERAIPITITAAPASTPPTASGVSVCSGGVASLTASGCANYYWYNGSGQLVATSGSSFTTPALSAATNYFVRCQNACGASDERAIPISITAAPASTPPTASGVSVCSGGVASLTASGCSTTYYWYNGSGQLISTGGGSFTTPALSANTNYFVRCQNPCGASDERAIPITITAAPASTPPTASGVSVCSGGVASLTASGCANYYWYNGSGQLVATSGSSFTTPALSAATNYFVRCQNACGASDERAIPITITAAPASTPPTASGVCVCSGGVASLTASGCANYYWYNGSGQLVATSGSSFTTPALSAATNYFVRCQNACGASDERAIPITITAAPASTPPTASGVSVCSGGVASLTASGCANYYWYNGSGQLVATSGSSFTTPALSAATNYFVRCQNACGASDERAIPISITAAPASTPPTASGVSVCSGGVASLTASGCANYYWYNGSGQLVATSGSSFTTPALSAATNYFVRCQNACGASDERAIPITITAAPASTPPTASGVSVCSGGVASLTASGCANYYWYNGSGQLVATSGSSFTTPALSAATNYFVRCQNACGASDERAIPITITAAPASTPPTASGVSVCSGGVASLTASGCSTTYYWYNGSGQLISTGGGSFTTPALSANTNYFVRCQNPCGASDERVIPISILSIPNSPTLTARVAGTSSTQSLTLTASGCPAGYTVQWSGPNNTTATGSSWLIASFTQTNTYSAQCQSSTVCASAAQITVNYINPSSPIIRTTATQVCAGQSVTLTADGCQTGTTVLWSGGQTGSSLTLTPTATATYKAYCAVGEVVGDPSTQLAITVLSSHTVTISGSQTFAVGETISLSAVSSASGAVTYRWSGPNNFTSTAQNPSIPTATTAMSGTYTVVATNATSCTATASYALSVDASLFSCTCQDCELDSVKTTYNPSIGLMNRGSSGQNYVLESVYMDAAGSSVAQTITYLDGLGRPVQKVSVGAGGKPGAVTDVVSIMAYDGFGRETVKYLPFADATNNGAFRSASASDISSYYTSLRKQGKAYTDISYEASPLNRVVSQIAPGTDNKAVTIAYRTNTANELSLLTYDYTTKMISVASYGAGKLYVTESTDENLNKSIEYKDLEGRVVGKIASGRKTLYVYDDFGWLRCVVPPKASGSLSTSFDPFAGDLLFAYDYDQRGRMTRKRVPGAGTSTMTYTDRDLLETTTDAKGVTVVTSYDKLDRIMSTSIASGQVLTKTFYDGSNLSAGNDPTHPIETSRLYGQTRKTDSYQGMVTGNWTARLDGGSPLASAIYYDDLGRVIQTVSDNHKGGLDYSSSKLDYVGRALESQLSTTNSSTTITVDTRTSYDVGSRVKSVCQRVSDNLQTPVTNTTLAYWEPVARHSYNGIGELTHKTLGCGIQNVDYAYQMRGWLTGINNPDNLNTGSLPADKRFFGMSLAYDAVGNITTWNYRNAQANYSPTNNLIQQPAYQYSFSYDNLNRLKSGNLTQTGQSGSVFTLGGDDSGQIRYDDNGNIKNLKRTFQNASTPVDNLTYTYKNGDTSNQLESVNDQGSNPANPNAFFKDGTASYTYDANGNLQSDNSKSISNIEYNYLNLPKQITRTGGLAAINYLYSASGQKLKADFGSGKTYDYVAGLVYDQAGLEFIPTAEGRVLPPGRASTTITTGNSATAANAFYRYEYNLKDHLGNLRAACRCGEKAVETSPADTQTPILVQEQHYDPFGLDLTGLNIQPGSTADRFTYNGKEVQPELGWLDYGARMYNPSTGQWNGVDILAEKWNSVSPYSFVINNPIKHIDHDGRDIILVVRGQNQKKDRTLTYKEGGAYWNDSGKKYEGKGANNTIWRIIKAYQKIEKSENETLKNELTTLIKSDKKHFVEAGDKNGVDRLPGDFSNPAAGERLSTHTHYDFSKEKKDDVKRIDGVPASDFSTVVHEMRHQYDYDIGNMKDATQSSSGDPAEVRAVHNENIAREIEGLPMRSSYGGIKIDPKKLKNPPNNL